MSDFTFAIKTAIVLFPIVALFFTIFYVIYQYHKYGSINGFRTIIIYSFILYLLSTYFLVILPLPSIEFTKTISIPAYNLTPFNFVFEIINKTGLEFSDFTTYFPTLKNAATLEAIFNVFLTIPFGVYLHYYFKCGLGKTIFYTFCLTLFLELTQLSGLYFIYPRSYRVFDVDDLILNTFGGFLGYFIGSLFIKILPSKDDMDRVSYKKGELVSLFRRFCYLMIDAFFIILLVFLESYFVYKKVISKVWLFIPFGLYFIFVIIFKRSIGMKYLNLKFTSFKGEVKRSNILLYYLSFVFVYFLMPVIIYFGGYLLYENGFITYKGFEYYIVVVLALSLMSFIILFLMKVFHQTLFYENLSGIKIASTINETIDEES